VSKKVTIVPSSGLTKDQIDKMVHDAESHASDDKRRKEEVEERNLADSAAYRCEKSLAELGDKLSSDLKSDLESKIADVRSALSGDDVAKIKSSRESLEQAFYKASESIYRQAGAGTGAGPSSEFGGEFSGDPQPTDPGQGAHDDTIEGEYKEM